MHHQIIKQTFFGRPRTFKCTLTNDETMDDDMYKAGHHIVKEKSCDSDDDMHDTKTSSN